MQIEIHEAPTVERFFRRRQVLEMFGLANSTLYAFIKQGRFPKPVPIGNRIVGWRESDLIKWQKSRMKGN